ncbi:hypothetical protein [Thalassotalea sediminis]|uniref:hypothetical protein n=1 Tax=Thalassotalea sediminis TaxID=1759089 RepID=UPI002572E3AE|nr:hypothetical protein [Thalassotalea sediminis]
MLRLLFTLSAVLFLLSFHVNAKPCEDGKMTIKAWSQKDGTYSNYNIPKIVINSNACLVKPMEGKSLQSSEEVISFISKQMTTDNKRRIFFNQLPGLLEAVGEKFDVYLVHPCDLGPNPEPDCENNEDVLLGFVAESTMNSGDKAYAVSSLSHRVVNKD